MPSKGADAPLADAAGEPEASALTTAIIGELPYEPSVPCGRCARGVDPLRAACVSAHDDGLLFFCSRACSDTHRQAERQLAARLAQREPRTPSSRASSRAPADAVARRVEPRRSATPTWPLPATALALLAAFVPLPGASRIAALALVGIAATFASQTALTRQRGGVVAWLAAPLGIALLGLAALLSDRPILLVAAALGSALMWMRELLLERSDAHLAALREELAARQATHVRVRTPGSSERVDRAVASVQVGDELFVEADEVVPVDARVLEGEAEVYPYPHAREPLLRRTGDTLLAGARVARGSLTLEALRVGRRRVLFRALEPTAATGLEPPLAWLAAARHAGIAAAPLLPAALLALIGAERPSDVLARLAAALLALPALLAAQGAHLPYQRARMAAARRGLWFRDFAALQAASAVDTVAVRVEGALVPRAYTLVELAPLSGTHHAEQLLRYALSAELVAEEHGLARAIRAYAEPLGVRAMPLRRLAYTKGRGITAITDSEGQLVLGSREALLSAGVSVAVADRQAQKAEQAGRRVVFLALGDHLRGLLVFEQSVRPEARVAVQTLFDLGIEVELVSGDHRATVEAIARPLDILHVKAELSAEQRAAEVRRLREGDARVAAVGIVPEDEALLGAAELALTLDAAGLAGEAELVSAGRDLRDGAAAFAIARAARREARAIAVAAGAGLLALALGASGAAPVVAVIASAFCLDFLVLARGIRRADAATRPKSH